jgi:hypothetical protein
MIWPILAGCVLLTWAMLRIMGNERQRRIDLFQLQIRIAAEKAKQAAEAIIELH